MDRKKEYIATLELLMITVWAAVQYIFLKNVPETFSTFAFLFITNLVGFGVLAVVNTKKMKEISKKTMLKGLLLAGELLGFNFFMLLGSRGLDSVIVSSLISMYFIFITPILIFLKKTVSFRAAVASVVAIIALLLMFNADVTMLFGSANVVLLLIADVFFAFYVISISFLGKNEDSAALTIAQLASSSVICFLGWCVEIVLGMSAFKMPSNGMFWITVLFFGVFLRALYGLIQMSAQKYVPPVNASLIFSSEIIITLITTPFLAKWMNTEYTPVNIYQVVGCVLFVVAIILVDDGIMSRIGYTDMVVKQYVDENGETRTQTTLSRKMTNMTLITSLAVLIVSTIICLGSITKIKSDAVEKSTELGTAAADKSENALKKELELELLSSANDKAMLAEAKLTTYMNAAKNASDGAASLYNHASNYSPKEAMYPLAENDGIWTMQRTLADETESMPYSQVQSENALLGNMEDVFKSIVENNSDIATIYIATEKGLMVSYDTNSGSAATGGESYYEFRKSEWYNKGKSVGEPFFTNAYLDNYGRGLTISCISPICDRSGEFKGCIGIDILMNNLNKSMVNDNIVEPDYATLIDESGNIIASKKIDETNISNIFDEKIETPIRAVAEEVLKETSGICSSGEGDRTTYVSYSLIPLTNWKICIMSPVAEIIKPAVSIRNDIDKHTQTVASSVDESIRNIINTCLILFAIVILVITYCVGMLSETVTKPLQCLEQDVLKISDGDFHQRTMVSTDDEVGSLARAFNYMTESLQNYIENLKEMTAKNERIEAELDVAKRIQETMLPCVFPAFPERKEFDIYATMTAAKEVGGDFYDFFLVDDDHIAMVMADVSGKGVPAAMFMMTSKTLIKSAAQAGLSPKEVLEKVNNQLCENNEAEMFVTVWLGILEISTGKMICANAGHEYPAIKHKGGLFELLKDKHGFVLAGMENMKYMEYELELAKGDMIFVYTDGVAEATNAEKQLYGTERMINALNKQENVSCERLLEIVHQDVNEFVAEAPQFDDITMLCFKMQEIC